MSALAELNGHSRPMDYALAYREAGLSPIPIPANGSKKPGGTWKRFQSQAASEQEIASSFLADNVGIAICYGDASGNAELIDFDEAEVYAPFVAEVEKVAPGLISRLTVNKTPRPGYHMVYRCEAVEGNRKLAQRWATPEELAAKPEEKTRTRIETRGRGGYALAPGGAAECHPTGRPYEHIAGPPLTDLSTITVEERDVLFRAARLFNEVVEAEPDEAPSNPSPHHATPGLSPGDDFNARASWDEILSPHGWTTSHALGNVQHWTRPGKDEGTSATTGLRSKQNNELFCCFSTSAHPFPGPDGNACSTHSKFGAYTLLNHSGDFAAAARQLASEGYGDAPQRQGMPNLLPDDVRDFGDIPEPTQVKPRKRAPEPVPPPAPYPVEALPAVLSEFVEDRAGALDVCPSIIALPALATCASAIGNSRIVRPTPSWSEPCALYVAILARSGERKSPALECATKALSDIDFELSDAYEDLLADFEEKRDRFAAEMKVWKKTADGPMPEEPKPPIEERHVCSNLTTEKLVHLLSENPRGLMLLHDELSSLFGNLDRYSGGAGVSGDAPLYLQAYSAKPYRHDRVTARRSVRLRRPLLSIAGAIQPNIFNRAMTEENKDNGLLSRFLITYPEERTHKWVDDARADHYAYGQLVTDLTQLHPAGIDGNKITPESVVFDAAAKELFRGWYESLQEERRLASDHEAAALAKLEGATARMALVVHVVRATAEEPVHACTVDATSMASALALMRWQRGETLRAYRALAGDTEIRERQRLAKWLIERFGGVVTVRDLQRSKPTKYETSEDAEQALNELRSSRFGEWTQEPNDGKRGRPKRKFTVHTQWGGK